MEMFAITAPLCSTLMFVVYVSADQKNITAGQDVNLTCRAQNNNIHIVQWSRADLKPEFVLVYRNGTFLTANQHPSFKNRVDLQDRQMKDGDVSLILKNVTINDTGTYECRFAKKEPNQTTVNLILTSIINLKVFVPPGPTGGPKKDEDNRDEGKDDRGKEDGSVGLIVGLSVPAVLPFAFVIFLIYRCRRQQSEETNQPPVDLQQV
ncbi:uncharacterized protein LOC109201291 [Oreochromis niloticus]|uniref:uncharacterized protein LOC109201291 n=1 Tax=Oreochromis niloticus TaxID=8128 RepID=UPI000DF42818|nr:uncharacterized protein LOC109201291 [Oreochromis niloticus]